MLFSLLIVLLALATAFLPILLSYAWKFFPAATPQPASPWLPILAGILLVISIQLPDIHISNQTSTFQQHFVGGGMYSACLYLYAKQLGNWHLHGLPDLFALFAWVSALGVANKLMEFTLLEMHLVHINTGDAYWDLLANTTGGLVGYALFFMLIKVV